MNTYEVFLKKAGKDEFRHAGSVEAPDDEMAQLYAREAYVRRNEGQEMWLVDRSHVLIGDPGFVGANADRSHRSNSGEFVAAHRKALRKESGK